MNDRSGATVPLPRAERQRLLLRQEIIDAASIEFSERGYHQTSISHIAKRIGMGHGTFYRHFENKRDILDHVIESVCDKIRVAMEEDNAPTASSSLKEYELQVQRMGVALSRIILERPGLFRILLLEATSVDDEMTQSVTDFLEWCSLQIAAYFENGVKQGFLRKDLDIAATSHVLLGMIFSSVLLPLNSRDSGMLERIEVSIRRMLLDGIARH